MAYTIDTVDPEFGSGGSFLGEQGTGGLHNLVSQLRTAIDGLDTRLTHLEFAAITTTSTTSTTTTTA